MRNPGQTVMACEPAFPMVRTVLIPAMDQALEQWGEVQGVQPCTRSTAGTVKVLCQQRKTGSGFEARILRCRLG